MENGSLLPLVSYTLIPIWIPHTFAQVHVLILGLLTRVGGVVAEPSYKFFYQMVFYGALYCLFLIVSIAVIFRQQINDNGNQDARWAACLAL